MRSNNRKKVLSGLIAAAFICLPTFGFARGYDSFDSSSYSRSTGANESPFSSTGYGDVGATNYSESSSEGDSEPATMTSLGDDGLSGNVTVSPLVDSGEVFGDFRMTDMVIEKVQQGVCPPSAITSIADMSYCMIRVATMDYRYGGGALEERHMLTSEQEMLLMAASTGDAKAQAVLLSLDPDLRERATESELDEINAIKDSLGSEENVFNEIFDNRESLRDTYIMAHTTPEAYERFKYSYDNVPVGSTAEEFIDRIASPEKFDYENIRAEGPTTEDIEKITLDNVETLGAELVERKNEMEQQLKDNDLLSPEAEVDEMWAKAKEYASNASPIVGGTILIWEAGKYLYRRIMGSDSDGSKRMFYGTMMENIRDNPKD